MFEEEYKLDFFKSLSYARHICPVCGKPFWSIGKEDNCGEVPCVEYGFIGTPIMDRKLGIHDMREHILTYFERNGHTRISRYPIVARWRDDVFYTQASIYDFQPRVTAGEDDPPANPLIVSQPCVRFNDIDNVGRTGRHMTMFEMIGHHVFNSPQKYVYWKEEAVTYCHNFLKKEVGIPENKIIYKEKPWFGGGNAGPSLEVICEGLELATLVFMNLKQDPQGDLILEDGYRYSKMAMQVVDPGWGLERFVWMSQASPSAYEAVFGTVLQNLKKELGISPDEKILSEFSRVAGTMNVETSADLKLLRSRVAERLGLSVERLERELMPIEYIYIICDHTRALMFILNDGVVPSNVKEGYYARLLVRRAIPAIKALGLNIPLRAIVEEQIKYFSWDFPELVDNRDDILKLVDWEEKAYSEMLHEGKNLISRMNMRIKSDGKQWGFNELRELYDSHGIRPEIVKELADSEVVVPEDFDQRLAKYHEERDRTVVKEEKDKKIRLPDGLPITELAFYAEEHTRFFTAEVLYVGSDFLVLNKTYFYPEGGGEESDTGRIDEAIVKSVTKIGSIVVHLIEGITSIFSKGQRVHCEIDWDRRMQLVAHHTATHIFNGVAREMLGNHVWQAGAHKSTEGGRLDITHYTGLQKNEVSEMEKRANEIVVQDLPIKKGFFERSIAEKKYGFRLYQGGAVPGKKLRIVNINDWDIEACGGTHADSTAEVGKIRITGTKRIQQGVVRIEFVAGEAAERYETQRQKEKVGTKNAKPKWQKSDASEIEARANALLEKGEIIGNIRIASDITDDEVPAILSVIRFLTNKGNVISVFGTTTGGKGTIIIARSQESEIDYIDASALLKHILPVIDGIGGGRKDFAQGGGKKIERLKEAVDTVVRDIKQNLEKK